MQTEKIVESQTEEVENVTQAQPDESVEVKTSESANQEESQSEEIQLTEVIETEPSETEISSEQAAVEYAAGPLPGSALPAHSQRGNEWCAGHRRRTDARRHQAHRNDGYVRGLPQFRHSHHDVALL